MPDTSRKEKLPSAKGSDSTDETFAEFGRLILETIEKKDGLFQRHNTRIAKMGYLLAEKLAMSKTQCEILGVACLMHDIGKIDLPNQLLSSSDYYSEDEFSAMKKHTIAGGNIFLKGDKDLIKTAHIVASYYYGKWNQLNYPDGAKKDNNFSQIEAELIETARVVALYHHEQWNGMGYPEGLKEKEIPFEARIISVVDVYDALLSERSYRSKWTNEEAVQYLIDNRFILFDPDILDVFLNGIEEFDAIREAHPD